MPLFWGDSLATFGGVPGAGAAGRGNLHTGNSLAIDVKQVAQLDLLLSELDDK